MSFHRSGRTRQRTEALGQQQQISALPSRPSSGHRLGTMQLVRASLVARLVASVATLVVADPERLCLPLAAPSNVMVGQPGRNVTLPCLAGESENPTLVQWRFEGQNLTTLPAGPSMAGADLFLPWVDFSHAGSYSCHAGRKLLRTWRLVVEEAPEISDFACHRKSLMKDILCEWKTARPVSMRTRGRLWVQKGFMGGNHTEEKCRYFAKSQKFTCRILGLINEDDILLWVTMCAANLAGASSEQKYLRTKQLLKPDPPGDVAVYPVEKATRKLLVTWRYPYSWGSTFYRLQFQLRYRPNISQSYSEIHLDNGATFYVISDALQGVLHTVQFPDIYDFVNTEKPKIPAIPNDKIPEGDPALASLHWVLIAVVSVTVVLTLIALISAWYRKRWGVSSTREGKPSTGPTYALAPLSPEPLLSASPLLSPPASPFSESSVDSPRILDNGPYDVANADYFLLPK
ncbi:hypothetical protein JRQ81_009328 [Phrynocephalus forsythii]|uniref:Ig-like domain-containing protein n=1 Tax=Phrynocephalus forsythii TaxID=171643 RepID=A0A9Q0XBL9_9SAUR|nr:hypothetical protein JRQ81_009328 [Phrynocephalus forsythii]